MIAQEIMTKDVICMNLKTNVLEAIDILVNNKISGAPVMDNNGKLSGIISEKDLLVSLDFIGSQNAENTFVSEFLTKDVITFTPDTKINEIIRVLVSKNIKRVPIVSEDKILGIVSRRDILRTMRQHI